MKSSAIACANIAFIKYWGKADEILRLPANSSVSMNLDSLYTTTTVDFNDSLINDEILMDGAAIHIVDNRISQHLDRIRALAGIKTKAKVATINNFPEACGLASSASGFAALTLAAAAAAGSNLTERELSIMARLGSGSACRSIPAGFVEWEKGTSSETSYATSIFNERHWEIADVVAIITREAKSIGSTSGQKAAHTSPFFPTRLVNIDSKIKQIKKYISGKNFTAFGELIESEALELHAIALTSKPALVYWHPQTLQLIRVIHAWRKQGLEAYFTIDAGPNVHIIAQDFNIETVVTEIKKTEGIMEVIVNRPGKGARLTDNHLF